MHVANACQSLGDDVHRELAVGGSHFFGTRKRLRWRSRAGSRGALCTCMYVRTPPRGCLLQEAALRANYCVVLQEPKVQLIFGLVFCTRLNSDEIIGDLRGALHLP